MKLILLRACVRLACFEACLARARSGISSVGRTAVSVLAAVGLFISVSAGASELREMLHAKSVAQLNAQTRSANERRSLQEACSAELRARLLPRSCFRELGSGADDAGSRTHLTRVCIRNARESRSRLDLAASTSGLPDECRKVAAERLDDLRYIDEAKESDIRTFGPQFEDTSSD